MLDIPSYLLGLQSGGGGGGQSTTIEPLTVTENGVTTAPFGTAYSPVTVEVEPALDTLVVTRNGTYTPDENVDGFSEVTVSVPADAVSATQKDVNFIDYDGTVVYSYTATEFAALSEMPANPTHSGLTSQGWNWSLSDAQTYVAKYGGLTIGQMYITDDGKTRIYIHLEEGRLSPYLGLAINGTAVIDWGDGTEADTVTGISDTTVINTQYTYMAAGDYVITIDVTGNMTLLGSSSGSCLLWKNSIERSENNVYQNAVRRAEIGSNTIIGSQAFSGCYSLSSVTIPDSVTSIGNNAFSYCYCLSSVTIPDNVTSIEDNTFVYCNNLSTIMIPKSVTNIGRSAFSSCSGFSSVTIPDSVTSVRDYAFSGCFALSNVTIPDSVTSIEDGVFGSCNCLSSVTIPDSVTSIGDSAFGSCNLSSITIPDSVTSLRNYAFSGCYSLGFIRFESTTPPTVSNSNAFSGLTTDCIIYVPAGTLSDYTSATNYPSSSTYTYVEY